MAPDHLACTSCGHEWTALIPVRPRVKRACLLGTPIVAMGIINLLIYHQPSMLLISAVGIYLTIAGFLMILPKCPACRSERTMRRWTQAKPVGPHLVDVPPSSSTKTK